MNGDGRVDISDVTDLIQALLTDAALDLQAADLNDDGLINIDDLTEMINYLISGN